MMHKGVRQGFPASLLAFPLYMDKLEEILESNQLAHLPAPKKSALRVAGIPLPSLIFEDEIVFLATQLFFAQCILNTLADFCV